MSKSSVVLLALVLGLGCDRDNNVLPRLGSIELRPDSLDLFVGDTASLHLELSGVRPEEVVTVSRAPSIARLETPTLLRAVSAGTTYVAADGTGQARPDSTRVAVFLRTVDCFLTVTPSSIRLGVGESVPLEVGGHDCPGRESQVLFHSTDTVVATVDTAGTVTGISPGNAVIVATLAINPAERATATVDVVP